MKSDRTKYQIDKNNDNTESERQIPSSVLQFLRTFFPGGEIHVEDSSVQGTTAGSTLDNILKIVLLLTVYFINKYIYFY